MSGFSDFSLVTSDVNAVNGSVAVWDGRTGVNIMILKGNVLSTNSMAVFKDTVVGCVEGKSLLEIWKLSNEGKKKFIPLPSPGRAVEYSYRFNILACFLGCEVFMWQPYSGQLIGVLRHVHSTLGSKIIFTESSRIITIDESGLVACWNIEHCECLWKCRPFGLTTVYACLMERMGGLLVAAENGKIIVLSFRDGSPLSQLIDLSLTVRCVLYHDTRVYIGCNKGTVVILSLLTMSVAEIIVKASSEFDHQITQLALTPDRTQLIIVVNGLTAFFMSLDTHKAANAKQFSFASPLHCLRIVNTSGDMFITSSEDSKIPINRLQFSLDSNWDGMNEIVVKNPSFNAQELLANIENFTYDYRSRRSDTDDKHRTFELTKRIFGILDK